MLYRLSLEEKIEVIILPEDEDAVDLIDASESSLKFWDNPIDDEIWNNVSPERHRSHSHPLH